MAKTVVIYHFLVFRCHVTLKSNSTAAMVNIVCS